jgi:hypothetical protein
LTPGLHGVEWQGWLCAKETGLVDDNDELPLDLVVPTAVLDLRWVQDRDVVRAE